MAKLDEMPVYLQSHIIIHGGNERWGLKSALNGQTTKLFSIYVEWLKGISLLVLIERCATPLSELKKTLSCICTDALALAFPGLSGMGLPYPWSLYMMYSSNQVVACC